MPKIFVGNIPYVAGEEELREWVESQGFPVESAEIIRDRNTGVARGFGFVLLRAESDLKEAIRVLNGQSMSGRRLTVGEATPPLATSARLAQRR